jgi:GAF domain-containing protein
METTATCARPPVPANEVERLAKLRELLILDTPPEERFDRLVQFAAEQCDLPIAALSLVDERRQWFKARVGLDVSETTRDIAFCAHAIHAPGTAVFEVEDATRDPRFRDNPLVTGGPGIRFYAGAPLETPEKVVLGTLCVIDTKPRRLDAADKAVLKAIRDLALAELLPAEGTR